MFEKPAKSPQTKVDRARRRGGHGADYLLHGLVLLPVRRLDPAEQPAVK